MKPSKKKRRERLSQKKGLAKQKEKGKNRQEPTATMFRNFTHYQVFALGAIYAIGSLVIMASHDCFGIREVGIDQWSPRHVHVGLLCVLFPLILSTTTYSFYCLLFNRDIKERKVRLQRLLPNGLLIVNSEAAIIGFILFTNKSINNLADLLPLLLIITVTFPGIMITTIIGRKMEKILTNKEKYIKKASYISNNVTVYSRWILVITVACLDVWFIIFYKEIFKEGFQTPALAYIGSSILLSAVVTKSIVYYKRQKSVKNKHAVLCLAISVIFLFTCLLALLFSYGVLPNIPAARGGMKVADRDMVVVVFKSPQVVNAKEKRFFSNSQCTVPLVLICQDNWAFYLADPTDAGGPLEWNKFNGHKPQIFIANKSEVSGIIPANYLNKSAEVKLSTDTAIR